MDVVDTPRWYGTTEEGGGGVRRPVADENTTSERGEDEVCVGEELQNLESREGTDEPTKSDGVQEVRTRTQRKRKGRGGKGIRWSGSRY